MKVRIVFNEGYFLDCDVMNAELGHCPSFIWYCIWGAKHVILKGPRWLIGNSLGLNAWSFCWIPRPNTVKLVSTVKAIWEDDAVANLLILILSDGGRTF